jgi:hypothetical protein
MPKRNPLAPPRPSDNAETLKLLGQFAIANYKMGSNENKGRPEPSDITTVERTRREYLDHMDKTYREKK